MAERDPKPANPPEPELAPVPAAERPAPMGATLERFPVLPQQRGRKRGSYRSKIRIRSWR